MQSISPIGGGGGTIGGGGGTISGGTSGPFGGGGGTSGPISSSPIGGGGGGGGGPRKSAQHEIKIVSGCPAGSVPQNKYINGLEIVVLSIILALILLYFIYIRFIASNISDSLYVRYKEFFTKASGKITITFVIGLLAWSLVSEFIVDILEPLVQAAIPDYSWYNTVLLKKYFLNDSSGNPEEIDIVMKPAQFVIKLLSFVVSLLIIFILAEIIYKISEIPYISLVFKHSASISYITLFGLILFFLVWTIINKDDQSQIKCISTGAPAAAIVGGTSEAPINLKATAASFANNISSKNFLTQTPTREYKPVLNSVYNADINDF